jgi:hypothetical protein
VALGSADVGDERRELFAAFEAKFGGVDRGFDRIDRIAFGGFDRMNRSYGDVF